MSCFCQNMFIIDEHALWNGDGGFFLNNIFSTEKRRYIIITGIYRKSVMTHSSLQAKCIFAEYTLYISKFDIIILLTLWFIELKWLTLKIKYFRVCMIRLNSICLVFLLHQKQFFCYFCSNLIRLTNISYRNLAKHHLSWHLNTYLPRASFTNRG